ncbi:MAG: type II toxin-antitoxin system HipA family toxin [bacterium]
MIYKLMVWERSNGDHQSVGEMVCDIHESGKLRSAFRYESGYLARPDAFTVDPLSLPLRTGSFSTEQPGLFGVFEDSLPDDWGRNLLIRKYRIPRHDQHLPGLLLALGHAGLGVLSFTEHDKPSPPPTEVSTLYLSELVEAVAKFERGETRDSDITLLLSAGSSPGGARPKAVVWDDGCREHCLAKFPSIKDQVDVVRIEAATMALAEQAGLLVPRIRLVECAGKAVLLVQRFDVMPTGRRHMISFQTLLKASGYYQQRYQDLLAVVRKYSRDPHTDSERLFRQMVFNAVVGNTDDHLKNFLMIYDLQAGWRLSPAFDLIPDVGRRGEHILFFDLDAYYPGRNNLEQLGLRWGIRNAVEVVKQVFDAIAGWKAAFNSVGVSDTDMTRFLDIDSRLRS